jgi:DNA-binding PadR family transcriptional regulator
MGARVLSDGSVSAMRSPIHWAVLGLLVERPGHGYDLFQRFDDAYAGAIELSTHSQINGAVKALEQRSLIERLAPSHPDAPARPRSTAIVYRATAKGLRDYEEWLMAWSPRSADAPGVFARQLAVLPTATALAVIERYEQACLGETCTTPVPRSDGGAPGDALELQGRLISEEKHLALAAKIEWARYARSQIKMFAGGQAHGQANAGGRADGRTGGRAARRGGIASMTRASERYAGARTDGRTDDQGSVA